MKKANQVLLELNDYVRAENLQIGDRLPPERDLAEILGTSRPTLRKILERLEQIGSLKRRRKGGTVIVDRLDSTMSYSSGRANVVSFITVGEEDSQEYKQRFLQEHLLSQGFVLNTYYATSDRQSPEKEQQYLRSLFRLNPKGLIVTASPFGGTNERIFAELAASGVRLVHIHYYQDRLPNESFAIPDWRVAGVMAVSYLQGRGCRQIVLAHPCGDTPHMKVLKAGVGESTAQLGIDALPNADIGRSDDVEDGSLAEFISTLSDDVGIITSPHEAGKKMAMELARQRGGRLEDQPIIAVDDAIAGAETIIPTLQFSWENRVLRALSCITDTQDNSIRELTLPRLVMPK